VSFVVLHIQSGHYVRNLKERTLELVATKDEADKFNRRIEAVDSLIDFIAYRVYSSDKFKIEIYEEANE